MANRKAGDALAALFEVLRGDGPSVQCVKEAGGGAVYRLVGHQYKVEIRVNPERWIGLEFVLLDGNGTARLTHDVDTDLYRVSRPEQREFAFEIEDEIVSFVEALTNGRIYVGELKGKVAMIVPGETGFYRIQRGRFLSTSKYYSELRQASAGGKFEPLNPAIGRNAETDDVDGA